MRTLLVILVFQICLVHISFAQINTDSLIAISQDKSLADSVRYQAINQELQFYKISDYQKLGDRAKELLPLVDSFKNDSYSGSIREQLAYHFIHVGQYDSVLTVIDESRSFFQSALDSNGLGDVAYTHSLYYSFQNIPDSSMFHAYKALDIYESIKDTIKMIGTMGKLSEIMNNIENLDGSLEIMRKALGLAKKINVPNTVARNNLSLGSTYYVKLNSIDPSDSLNYAAIIDSCRYYYENAYHGFKELSYDRGVMISAANLGMLYVNTQEYRKALVYMKQAEKMLVKFGQTSGTYRIKTEMASAHMNLKEYEKALKLLEQARLYFENQNEPDNLMGVYNNLSRVYAHMGRYDDAYPIMRKYVDAKQDSYNENQRMEINELREKYETEKKEQEIKSLKIEDELNQSRITQQRMMIGGSLGALGLLGFLFFRVRSKNQKIEEQNGIISKALGEKEILLKEIHHRVKNNLQVISSLLGIQSRTIKDEKAKDAIKEGRTRVHSMSLIHQNLYQKDNLTGIQMDEYLPKLSQSLFDTYNITDGEQIRLRTDIEAMKLDVETVIPIGLIVNELITNALKYAFPDGESGEIFVGLREGDDQLILTVSDNGIGLSTDQLEQKEKSFGHTLIRAFKSKLDADININSTNGTQIELAIRKYKKIIEDV